MTKTTLHPSQQALADLITSDRIELKQKRIDEMRKTVMITHRVELIDQNSAYPAHLINADPIPYNKDADWNRAGQIVIYDHAESPVKRWQASMDARVRPEHMARTATPELNHDYGKMADPWRDCIGYRTPCVQIVGRGIRAKPGFTSGHNGDRLYQVFPRGKKFVTRVYVRGMWIKTMFSKRRKTAIRKGKEWIGE